MLGAAASLAMLSPVGRSDVELDTDKKLAIEASSTYPLIKFTSLLFVERFLNHLQHSFWRSLLLQICF